MPQSKTRFSYNSNLMLLLRQTRRRRRDIETTLRQQLLRAKRLVGEKAVGKDRKKVRMHTLTLLSLIATRNCSGIYI